MTVMERRRNKFQKGNTGTRVEMEAIEKWSEEMSGSERRRKRGIMSQHGVTSDQEIAISRGQTSRIVSKML